MGDPLNERKRANEESFFDKQNKEAMEKFLKSKEEALKAEAEEELRQKAEKKKIGNE